MGHYLPARVRGSRDRYRWLVLAAGSLATASFSTFAIGLPILAPALRREYDLSLARVGLILSAASIGALATVFVWGLAADRLGERRVLAIGLSLCSLGLAIASFSSTYAAVIILITLAGASGTSVNSAGGRAIMRWFDSGERGLALSIRQTAVPVGGLLAAVALPLIERAGGVQAALLSLAIFCFVGAVAGAIIIRDRHLGSSAAVPPMVLRDRRLLRLCVGSGLYVCSQTVMIGFVVLFLHDSRGFSTSSAAQVLAAIYILATLGRICAGRWSDSIGARVLPLRRLGLCICVAVSLVAALAHAPRVILVPTLIAAGGLSMAWNGLPVAAAAEFAGHLRSGGAIGAQQTLVAFVAAVTPVAFAAIVDAASWPVGFLCSAGVTFAGWWVLGPLTEPLKFGARP